MALLMNNTGFVFGVPKPEDLKPLPDGWEYLSSPRTFLKAKSPDGGLWYVVRYGVIRCRIATAEDAGRFGFREGEEFLDETETLTFSGWAAIG